MDKPTPSPYATLIYSKKFQSEINCMGLYFFRHSLIMKINQKAAHEVLIIICLALSSGEEALASFSDFWWFSISSIVSMNR